MVSIVTTRFFNPLSEFECLVVGVIGHVVRAGLRVPGTAADHRAHAAVRRALSVRRRPQAALSTTAAFQLTLIGFVHKPRYCPVVTYFG